ncbi:MAG: aspartate aminotransferase family protein [Gammaproteobacteria bacterium]|nr:aspartate aminotransferase family protein [Gammaproteobacteria bacterium]
MKGTTDLNMVNAFIPGQVDLDPQMSQMIERRETLLGPAYRLMYERPLHIVKGEGVWLIDQDGNKFLDAYNNVASLGHCHPEITEAICNQVQTLATNTRYLHNMIMELADALITTVPETNLKHLMLTCSGSEANDLAFRIAKQFTDGVGIIVTETAYHGFTDAVSQFSPSLGTGVNLGTHVKTVPAPNAYHAEGVDIASKFTSDVQHAIDDFRRHGIKPAALIIDSAFTSDGILTGEPGLIAGAVEAIKQAGGIYIADEVQAGFARTGESMWGFQRHGVIPDIVTIGKPMGNGHPVAGLMVSHEVVENFGINSRYFNTFGGNTVSCAAALAVLNVIKSQDILSNANTVGTHLREGIEKLMTKYPCIGDVRGVGMFVGVELVKDRQSKQPDRELTSRVVNRMQQNQVLISACAKGHNVLKIRPPLILTKEQADLIITTLDKALAETL